MDGMEIPYIRYGNLDKARNIFYYCVDNVFDTDAIEKYALSINMTTKSVKRLAYIYYLYANKIEKETYEKAFNEGQQKLVEKRKKEMFLKAKRAEYIPLFESLSKTNDENEIINILANVNADKKVGYPELRDIAYSYAYCLDNGLSVEEKASLCDDLRRKLSIYYRKMYDDRMVQKKQNITSIKDKTEKDKIELAKNYIENHFSNIQLFSIQKKEDLDELVKNLLFIKKHDINLYNDYKRQQEEIKKGIIEKETEVVRTIMNTAKKQSNEKNDFTLLDYYLLTSIPLDKFYNSAKRLNSIDDIRFIKRLVDKYKSTRPIKEQAILDANIILNINGKLVTVNEDDKIIVIKFLNERKIELLESIVYLALKKYLIGEIKIESEQINCMIKRR